MANFTDDEKSVDSGGLDELGQIVRYHRKKSGLTQAELARLAGIGKTAIFDLENGTKQPRLATIARVLEVLNIKVRFESPLMADFEEQQRAESKSPNP